jgi:hypothetical protein
MPRSKRLKLGAAIRWVMAVALVSAVAAVAADKAGDKKDKVKPSAPQMVDSGSFGVFIKGQRVITETFDIQQDSDYSSIKAQLKETTGATPTDQKSNLEVTSNGQIIRYEWSQAAGGSLLVLPKDEFLIEKITATPTAKAAEQPFLMPNTSTILDNNFFIHREVMAWRYLATAPCHGDAGNRQCQPEEFGVLVPQDRTSLRVRMELVGKEKVTIRGEQRELLRLNLRGDGFDWALYLDDRYKLMRVAIPADNTEVVRD